MDLQPEKVIWARKVRVFSGRKNSQKVNKKKQTGSKVHTACCRVSGTASSVENANQETLLLAGYIPHRESLHISCRRLYSLSTVPQRTQPCVLPSHQHVPLS